MALAYRNFLNVPKKMSWQFASQRQAAVGYGGYEGLKKVSLREEAIEKNQQDEAEEEHEKKEEEEEEKFQCQK